MLKRISNKSSLPVFKSMAESGIFESGCVTVQDMFSRLVGYY